MTISESDMTFGDYPEENVLWLEKLPAYTASLRPHGVKSCEFALLRGETEKALCFIEAKKSSPRELKEYAGDIAEKLRHSLTLYENILLERQAAELPRSFRELDHGKCRIYLILVIRDAKAEWLPPIQDRLRQLTEAERRLFRTEPILVLNEELARKKRYII